MFVYEEERKTRSATPSHRNTCARSANATLKCARVGATLLGGPQTIPRRLTLSCLAALPVHMFAFSYFLFIFLILAWPVTDTTPLVWLLPARAIATNNATRSQHCSTALFCCDACFSSFVAHSWLFVPFCLCVCDFSVYCRCRIVGAAGPVWLTGSLASCWFVYALGPNHRRSLTVAFSLWVSLDSARCVLGSVHYDDIFSSLALCRVYDLICCLTTKCSVFREFVILPPCKL